MVAGASGAHGRVVHKLVVEMFLHKTVLDIVMIQCQCLVANYAMEKVLIFKLIHVITVALTLVLK